MNKTILISLGGSIIAPDGVDVLFLRKFRTCILEYVSQGYKFVIVCGGGKTCRDYQHAATKVTAISKNERDWVGIYATLLNARLVLAIFSHCAHPTLLANPRTRKEIQEPIAVAGGYKPGCSTDNDAILLARSLGIKRVINASVIDYVFDRDPNKDTRAKKIKKISWKEFRNVIPSEWEPGIHTPFDPVAARNAQKFGIEVSVLNGRNISNLKKCIEGKPFKGTSIY